MDRYMYYDVTYHAAVQDAIWYRLPSCVLRI